MPDHGLRLSCLLSGMSEGVPQAGKRESFSPGQRAVRAQQPQGGEGQQLHFDRPFVFRVFTGGRGGGRFNSACSG